MRTIFVVEDKGDQLREYTGIARGEVENAKAADKISVVPIQTRKELDKYLADKQGDERIIAASVDDDLWGVLTATQIATILRRAGTKQIAFYTGITDDAPLRFYVRGISELDSSAHLEIIEKGQPHRLREFFAKAIEAELALTNGGPDGI